MNTNMCKDCSNREICGKKIVSSCEHFDVSFTRSEIYNMLETANTSERYSLLKAIEKEYKIKLAY